MLRGFHGGCCVQSHIRSPAARFTEMRVGLLRRSYPCSSSLSAPILPLGPTVDGDEDGKTPSDRLVKRGNRKGETRWGFVARQPIRQRDGEWFSFREILDVHAMKYVLPRRSLRSTAPGIRAFCRFYDAEYVIWWGRVEDLGVLLSVRLNGRLGSILVEVSMQFRISVHLGFNKAI